MALSYTAFMRRNASGMTFFMLSVGVEMSYTLAFITRITISMGVLVAERLIRIIGGVEFMTGTGKG